MTLIRGLTLGEIEVREKVLENLVSKALRMSLRGLSAQVNRTFAASVQLAAEPRQPPDAAAFASTQAAGVVATWQSYVDAEILPYLAATYREAAEVTQEGIQAATGVAVAVATTDFATQFFTEAARRYGNLGDAVWTLVQAELAAGQALGEGVRELAARVRGVSGLSQRKAVALVRSEVVAAANAASFAQMQLAGFTDDEVDKVWEATDDSRTRAWHVEADGQSVALNEPFIVGYEALMFPGDPTASAENTYNCRCTIVYDFKDDEPQTAAADPWTEEDERLHPRGGDGRWTAKSAGAKTFKVPIHEMFDDDNDLDSHAEQTLRDAYEGTFAGLRTEVTSVEKKTADRIAVTGQIYAGDDDSQPVGDFMRHIRRDSQGNIRADHRLLKINRYVQGTGFAREYNEHLIENLYKPNKFVSISLNADIDVGGYAWAVACYDWMRGDLDGPLNVLLRTQLATEAKSWKSSDLLDIPEDATRVQIAEMMKHFKMIPDDRRDDQLRLAQDLYLDIGDTVTDETGDDELDEALSMWPTPFEISQLGRWEGAGKNDWWIGKVIMMGSDWFGVRYLDDDR